MTTSLPSRQRHFPYQHPTFGRGAKKRHEDAWKRTIYYAWWAYLKRNDEYLQTCESGGNGTLSKLYADFGDVRGDDFKAWWFEDKRGERLFSNPPSESNVRVVTKSDVESLGEEVLLVSVPLHLPKKNLVQRFRQLLIEHHQGKRGKQYAKLDKNAAYKFNGQPKIDSLLIGLEVYDQAKANPKMKLWQLGQFVPNLRSKLEEYLAGGSPPDTVDKKIIEASVSRYKRNAKASIQNAGLGQFP